MTEKRFILKPNGIIDDTELNILLDGGEDKEDMVDLLNELNEENQHLKKTIIATDELLTNQWRENQRIKHTIKEAHYNERTAIGKSVLKQLLEQME